MKNLENLNDDEYIISRINLGEKVLFENLVKKYQTKLRCFCSSMLQDKFLGDDAAQEVFVKAFRSLNKFRADSLFSSWLFKIARNHCLDLIRKKKRRPEESFDNLIEQVGDKVHLAFAFNQPNQNSFEANQFLEVLLATLSEKYREVLILREMYGMSYDEMANITDTSIDSVKATLKRARKEISSKLRHFLTESSSK